MTERFLGSVEQLGDREIGVIAATSDLARDGHILEVSGIDLSNFRKNPIVLWSHDPTQPVGVATSIGVEGGALAARIAFAPAGISATADEICALAKCGTIRGISVGFDPLDSVPLDPSRPRGGQRITKSELFEISLVAVPADTGAAIIVRSFKSRPGALALLRSLPIVTTEALQRATAAIAQANLARGPLTANEQWERERRHCMTTWALGQAAREEERHRYSYEARQADLRRLSGSALH